MPIIKAAPSYVKLRMKPSVEWLHCLLRYTEVYWLAAGTNTRIKGGQHEVRIEPNDSNCYGNTRRIEFECCDDDQWSGCTGCTTTETTNGRRSLQECHRSQGASGRRVHGHDGNDRGGTGSELPGLPYLGRRQELGTLRCRHHDEADFTKNDPDGERYK